MEFQIRMLSGVRGDPVNAQWTVQSQFEILSFGAGYGFPGRLSLLYSGDHDDTPVVDNSPARNMDNWVEMQVSNDSFTNICWWGYLNVNKPRGIRTEGIEYEALGLEAFLDNYLVSWNHRTYNTYNANNNRDYTSPAGTNWTLKQILADILEHMLGIGAPNATWLTGSMVYPHHTRVDVGGAVDVSSVNKVPMMRLDAPSSYSAFAEFRTPD